MPIGKVFLGRIFACALALFIALNALRLSPELRTRGYFLLLRNGLGLETLGHKGLYLRRSLEPFVPVWVQVTPHAKMLLDPHDLVSRTILETGSWERASREAIERRLPKGGTFVDIGAHIGYYSLTLAPFVGETGHVLSIEPNPETARKLRDNVRASDAAAVITIHQVACSDSEATVDLFSSPSWNTGETSLSRVNAAQEGPVTRTYRVRARPLDAIIREAGVSRVDAIKIDVEGAEYLVLRGAKETLDRYHPVVLVELKDYQLKAMGASAAEVIAFLLAHKYQTGVPYNENFEFDPQPDAQSPAAKLAPSPMAPTSMPR